MHERVFMFFWYEIIKYLLINLKILKNKSSFLLLHSLMTRDETQEKNVW